METYETAAMSEAIAEIKGYNFCQLAGRAECADPDANDSAGAKFLDSVRDGVVEVIDYHADELDRVEDFDNLDDDGALHEIADGAPDVYNHTMWGEFHDLAAWQEDPSELGDTDGQDMTKLASWCLFQIARRLVDALVQEVRDAVENADEDE